MVGAVEVRGAVWGGFGVAVRMGLGMWFCRVTMGTSGISSQLCKFAIVLFIYCKPKRSSLKVLLLFGSDSNCM